MKSPVAACPLCQDPGGLLVWEAERFVVVRVIDEDTPAFYRVISTSHIREFSHLPEHERLEMLSALVTVEQVLLDVLTPTTVNIAKFGNVVPHLHWHVMARFDWDSHFPDPLWGSRQRAVAPPAVERLAVPLVRLDSLLSARLDRRFAGAAK